MTVKILDLNHFRGWFVGSFEPTLVHSKDIEVGVKRVKKGTSPDFHYHKLKTEYTILLEGLVSIEGVSYSPITCFQIDPYIKAPLFFLEDSLILVINTPSCKGDKYFD